MEKQSKDSILKISLCCHEEIKEGICTLCGDSAIEMDVFDYAIQQDRCFECPFLVVEQRRGECSLIEGEEKACPAYSDYELLKRE